MTRKTQKYPEFPEFEVIGTAESVETKTKYPSEIKIFDIVYKIIYADKPSDVDIYKRDSLWGQIDYWTRTIRIYRANRTYDDIMQTIWHEVIHGIAEALHIDGVINDENQIVDLLATGINSIISDNKWVKYKK